LQEVAYQALYHIIIQTDLEAETLCGLSQLCLGRFSFSFLSFVFAAISGCEVAFQCICSQ
jgi:hypothetical protein